MDREERELGYYMNNEMELMKFLGYIFLMAILYFVYTFCLHFLFIFQDEKKRIENLGGAVIHWGTWRVNGQLAVSRAIGEFLFFIICLLKFS